MCAIMFPMIMMYLELLAAEKVQKAPVTCSTIQTLSYMDGQKPGPLVPVCYYPVIQEVVSSLVILFNHKSQFVTTLYLNGMYSA